MSVDAARNNRRKWALLGGLGFGLAMLGRRKRWRRAMMSGMYGGGFGGHRWGRFGGYGPWAQQGGPAQPVTLPPFIEATLKAWHDRAHGQVPPTSGSPDQPTTTTV